MKIDSLKPTPVDNPIQLRANIKEMHEKKAVVSCSYLRLNLKCGKDNGEPPQILPLYLLTGPCKFCWEVSIPSRIPKGYLSMQAGTGSKV